MAEIKLSELNLAGSELLQNSESFLDELGDREYRKPSWRRHS
jgi:hypothetical protein